MAGTPTKVRLTQDQLMQKYQYERQKLMAFEQKRESLMNLLLETEGALTAVTAIEKSQDDDKILLPLGAGVYVDAAIEDKKNIKTSYAGNIFVNRDIKSTKKDLEQRRDELKNNITGLTQEEENSLKNISSIEQILKQFQMQNPTEKE